MLREQRHIFFFAPLLICGAFGICLGLLILILGCAIWNTWWSLFSILIFLMAPIPDLMAKIFIGIRGKGIDELYAETPSVSLGEHLGACFTAALATLGFGLNFVLFHTGAIGVFTFIFQLLGGFVIAFTIVFVLLSSRVIVFKKKKEFDF